MRNFGVGKDVTWDGETQTITASKGSSKINLKIDSNEAFISGRGIQLNVSPRFGIFKIMGTRTMCVSAIEKAANPLWDKPPFLGPGKILSNIINVSLKIKIWNH